MTAIDGLLVIAGFALGCLPMVEWLIRRGAYSPQPQAPRQWAPSPWI